MPGHSAKASSLCQTRPLQRAQRPPLHPTGSNVHPAHACFGMMSTPDESNKEKDCKGIATTLTFNAGIPVWHFVQC